MKASEIHGLPVVSRESARELGEVRTLLLDVGGRRVAAVEVDAGGRARAGWGSVVGVGADAMVLENENALHDPADDERQRLAPAADLPERLVLDDRGDAEGKLADVEIDPEDGRLVALLVGEDRIDAERLRSIGGYAVVVSSARG